MGIDFNKKMSLLNLTFRNKALLGARISFKPNVVTAPITIQQRFGHVYYGPTKHVMPKTKTGSPLMWLWSEGLDTYCFSPHKSLGWSVARDCLFQSILMGCIICCLMFLKFFMSM